MNIPLCDPKQIDGTQKIWDFVIKIQHFFDNSLHEQTLQKMLSKYVVQQFNISLLQIW